jgi:hypothetical protein
MSPENKHRLFLMQKAHDGAPIQSKGNWPGATWIDNKDPQWIWGSFAYRIKEGHETIKKVLGFATGNHNLSDVRGVWTTPDTSLPIHYPNVSDYPHQCIIFVEVDIYTHKVVGVSFENIEKENQNAV